MTIPFDNSDSFDDSMSFDDGDFSEGPADRDSASRHSMGTTRFEPVPTLTAHGTKRSQPDPRLLATYDELTASNKISWTGHYRLAKCLGRGGQGEVYLTEYRGTDGFTVPVAMKIFTPERYPGLAAYAEAMSRIAGMSARIAMIQHDNLLSIQNFFERSGIRIMMMEYVDGYDLDFLVQPSCLAALAGRVSSRRWRYINEVILTKGPTQSRFKAGIAVAIVRECLAALAALHRQGIMHGDIKPSNIMLKRSGHAKLIDVNAALDVTQPPAYRDCTPMYAAPEVLENGPPTIQSDLASLGYVLVQWLAGRNPFQGLHSVGELLKAKHELPQRLEEILPDDVRRNGLLMNFVSGLIAPDVNRRFPNAEIAEHVDTGAAAFHRQLVLSHMATEYDNDIRVWLEELGRLEDADQDPNGEAAL